MTEKLPTAAQDKAPVSPRKPPTMTLDRCKVKFIRGLRTIERAVAGTTRPLPVAGLAGFSRGDR